MMSTITVLCKRDGKIKAMYPGAEVRSDRSVWVRGKPIVDGNAEGGLEKEQLQKLMRAGNYDAIPACNFARMGENPSGLELIDNAKYIEARKQEAQEYAATHPEVAERQKIDSLYAKANKIANSDSEDNVWLPIKLRKDADKMLAEWKEKYPEAAKKENAQRLKDRAESLRESAVGALVYDADGWLSSEVQQQRHDEMIERAEKLEQEAKQNESGN